MSAGSRTSSGDCAQLALDAVHRVPELGFVGARGRALVRARRGDRFRRRVRRRPASASASGKASEAPRRERRLISGRPFEHVVRGLARAGRVAQVAGLAGQEVEPDDLAGAQVDQRGHADLPAAADVAAEQQARPTMRSALRPPLV